MYRNPVRECCQCEYCKKEKKNKKKKEDNKLVKKIIQQEDKINKIVQQIIDY